jgi:hypothetical protein
VDLSSICTGFGSYHKFHKCAIYLVVCTTLQIEGLLDVIPCEVKDFPCKYLGLPLHTRALRKIDVQPLIDRIASKLSSWKAKFLEYRSGRLTLVNSILMSMLVHFIVWLDGQKQPGQKKKLDGLSILDLERFSRALRLRWLWQEWASPERPSAGDYCTLQFSGQSAISSVNGGHGWQGR